MKRNFIAQWRAGFNSSKQNRKRKANFSFVQYSEDERQTKLTAFGGRLTVLNNFIFHIILKKTNRRKRIKLENSASFEEPDYAFLYRLGFIALGRPLRTGKSEP